VAADRALAATETHLRMIEQCKPIAPQ
jgi:hypothetical protein